MKIRRRKFNNAFDVDEIEEQIEDQTFYLVPGHQYDLRHHYETNQGYNQLHQASKASFNRKYALKNGELSKKSYTCARKVLPAKLCQELIQEHLANPDTIKQTNAIQSLLPLILSHDIDSQICSYFGSEYTLLWYSYLETETHTDAERRSYSSYWHCDGGPESHLKMLVYLNDYKDHLGNTRILDKATTDKLKNIGYIFGDIQFRSADLEPLARAKNIDLKPIMYDDIQAGDALIFNPNQLAHIGKIPELANRHVLQLCFIPSPFHWQYTTEHIQPPETYCVDFANGYTQKLLSHAIDKPQKAHYEVFIRADNGIHSPNQLKWLIEDMCGDSKYANKMYSRLIALDPQLQQLNSINAVLTTLKDTIKNSLDWEGELDLASIQHLAQIATYEHELNVSIARYNPKNKPNPSGIYWPMPDHPTHPASKYDALPFVQKHPIMDIHTSIGSAGSCFAFEIAKVFQEANYNYVVTERNDNPNSGIVIAGYNPGDAIAKFSANYGILFNTPSFRQLAERAFAVKPTPKRLFERPEGGWVDPYREGVLFFNKESYLEDYDRHINATRNALEQVEVFIITLGLNECWQFRDGSAMSRNPTSNMYPYIKHKTLTVQENVDNIQGFFDIIKQHNPDFKLIISVSPIPFLATGRADEHHVISANTHSKSILRIAADELVRNNQDIYYLPSYELVMECIEDAWEVDTRHVKKTTVERVVGMFKDIFTRSKTDL